MSDPDRRTAAIALARVLGLDAPGTAAQLESGDPPTLLRTQLGTGVTLLPDDPAPLLERARTDLRRWAAAGFTVLTVADETYPASLRTVHDRPAVLFVAGDPALLDADDPFAIVGTRHPSAEGISRATRAAAELTAAGATVVSGLAAGIDAAAHRGALHTGGRTIAVIGTGLRHAYPPTNASLQAEIARDHTVVSPFWPETGPSAATFRRRNGVISGLALGSLIIEASARSGTRVLARRALAHGRPVFLLASLLEQAWARELAARPGVHVVADATEALTIARRALDPRPEAAS